ncbi:hypothetical protein H4991_08895 [Campylobacter jejuni]|uniref:flagellin N-terminal helical domain-containing protein n=1 Tax=Campylobacter jejuni TaxID=197 RepID=UPI0015FACAA8|nr:hypothetical protein [Campylobacter jejuni]QMX71015.1 hypothetical protein H4991_08895 [Campylobacter jejuni]
MGFRINTNIGALNAHANSVVNARELDKSLSRLSSGLRINSAADDASGMAIADSLRSQAATLGQAINNGNDAIGILQTADKAMDEQLKILDTIKTKATQAAQDGQSLKTRTMLQADINRLMVLDDALALKQILENILSKDFLLPLEFLEKVYQNIENFNHSLDEDEFIQDEVLRGAFAYRGKMIADVLKLHIKDETHFITAYIKAYHEWLLYFIEKLEQKYKFLSKV